VAVEKGGDERVVGGDVDTKGFGNGQITVTSLEMCNGADRRMDGEEESTAGELTIESKTKKEKRGKKKARAEVPAVEGKGTEHVHVKKKKKAEDKF